MTVNAHMLFYDTSKRKKVGFVKSPTAVLRCILRCFRVRQVRIIAQDLRALHLNFYTLPSNSTFYKTIKKYNKTEDITMQNHKEQNVFTLSDHPAFEKNELFAPEKTEPAHRDKDMDFIETLFRFLGDKRHTVVSFIRMKLVRQRRAFFSNELEMCENLRQEGRCVKKYIGHLKVNDAKALLMSLPELLPGKIEALIYHGETSPENRLMKFAKTFDLSDEDALFCMFMFLMMRKDSVKTEPLNMGRAI